MRKVFNDPSTSARSPDFSFFIFFLFLFLGMVQTVLSKYQQTPPPRPIEFNEEDYRARNPTVGSPVGLHNNRTNDTVSMAVFKGGDRRNDVTVGGESRRDDSRLNA